MSRQPKMLASAKAERQRRQAEQERREKRKNRWMLAGVILLMVVGLLADVVFIGWQKHQRRLRHIQHQSPTNHSAGSNRARLEAPAVFVTTNLEAGSQERNPPTGH